MGLPNPAFNIRVGQGFDLHRLVDGRPFILGGVPIEWPKGALGHSDGDVLLHAVMDAVLGAAGLPDIGEWFPPSDAKLVGADSRNLLSQVMRAVTEKGWQVVNIDTTILLEAPKLGAIKPQIRETLGELLNISLDQVSVKAKTMETLGPIGQNEAVAAFATVLLSPISS